MEMKKSYKLGYQIACTLLLLGTPLISAGTALAETATSDSQSVELATTSSEAVAPANSTAETSEVINTETTEVSTEITEATAETTESITTSTTTATTEEHSAETEASSTKVPSMVTTTESTTTDEENSEEVQPITVEKLTSVNRYVKVKSFTTPETQTADSRQILYGINNLQLTAKGTTSELAGNVYKSSNRYQDATTKKEYVELLDGKNQLIGIVETQGVTIANGSFHTENKYATIKSPNYPLWTSIFFDGQLNTTKTVLNQTFQVKESFKHGNGSTYYALYTNTNEFIGWVNSNGVYDATTPGGKWRAESKYATVVKNNYTLWKNFTWTAKKGNTASLYGKTVKVKGSYRHMNGITYYSLYDSKDKWLGYINAAGVKLSTNKQGTYQTYGKYVTITKKNYTVWGNFSWTNKKNNTSSLYGKTYKAKGKYGHWNQSTYYSLYDANDKWIGYLNADAATVANNQGGTWQSENKTIRMKSKNYTLWQNLNFSKKKAMSSSYMNKDIQVKGKYQHFNGSTYYSLYLNNTWLGYINATGVTSAHVIHSQTNISRYVIVNNASGNFLNAADPNSSKLGSKSSYKGYMAQATKLAKTSDGNYLYLVSPAGKIGWIKENQTYSVNDNFWMYTTGGKYPSLNVKNLNIHVSISKQRIYIKSGDKVIYTMLCSTGAIGTPTPLGNYRIQGEKGLAFSGAAYYRSFKDHGIYLFHSIPTSVAWSTTSFDPVEGRKLGKRASHGCIRMSIPDAKWFYYNMPYNTPVKIAN
jgi:lipoprotein-anchoring transpeptidase ErfK/SrfK